MGLGSYGRVLSLLMLPDLPDPEELYLHERGEETHQDEPEDWRTQLRREAGYGES